MYSQPQPQPQPQQQPQGGGMYGQPQQAGGSIYGQPQQHVHAIQLEMSQMLYMQEDAPFAYVPDRAAQIQPLLQQMLGTALAQLPSLRPR